MEQGKKHDVNAVPEQPVLSESELLKARKDNLEYFVNKGNVPYKYGYDRSGTIAEIKERNGSVAEGVEGEITERAAGRIMSIRAHGKTTFANLKDFSGTIQVYIRKDAVGDEAYEDFKKMDIGDIFGVEGKVFKTKTGELTVKADKFDLLTKSLLPLPEKWHGLKDKETRYRKRYLDLISNEEVMNTFVLRTKIIKEIRNFLDSRGFLEVETPMMQAIPGGAKAKPFLTHHNALDMDLFMRIAPELYLKRLLVGGFEKVYEINRNFRNEGISIKHNPEFTMVELYQAYTDFQGVMNLCEEMIAHLADKLLGRMIITYQGSEIDLTPPWKRISMKDAIKEYAEIDFDSKSEAQLEEILKAKEVDVRPGALRGELLELVFGELVEPKLMGPVFITDFPVEISPLAKVNRNNPAITERFEPYIFGRELANGFSELNDSEDQERRFRQQIDMDTHGEVAKAIDEDYVEALKYGMPPAGGLGIGIDRLIMFLTDSASIRDVILFPLLRPEK